jgi:hypothetical protein
MKQCYVDFPALDSASVKTTTSAPPDRALDRHAVQSLMLASDVEYFGNHNQYSVRHHRRLTIG